MRIVRLQRASIQQKYIDAYSRSWTAVMNTRPVAVEPATTPAADSGADSTRMSPEQQNQLELDAAVTNITNRISEQFGSSIEQLSERLEAVCGKQLVAGLNPLGPECISNNFINAISTLDVDLKVRIALLKLFETFVTDELAEVYDRANAILIAAERAAQPQGSPLENVVINEPAPAAQAQPAAPPEFVELQSMLSRRRIPGDNVASSDSAAGSDALLSTPQLLQALDAAQEGTCAEPLNLDAKAAPVDFRALLLDPAREPSGNTAARLEQQSDDILDLVKRLFAYILDDKNLATPMQALIGRLQVPLLKVAIIDQTLFAQPSHPARQLLNELASAGIGWSNSGELKRDETYNKIESIVSRVTRGFTQDLTLFSNLIAELRHFLKKEQKKRNQVEQRVRETAAGKARAREAKKTVQTLINDKVCGVLVPPDTGSFIGDTWSRVLVFLFVTQGADSPDWVEGVQTLDDLLWAARPLASDWDIARRESLLPELLTRLESGITQANLPEAQDALNALGNTIQTIHNADLNALESQQSTDSTDLAPLQEPEELKLLSAEDTEQGELEDLADPQFIEEILQLSEGQWVELRDDSNALIRAKLATIVQPGNRYVFVNRKGMKVCERSRNALALALQNEGLNLLSESDMFERALEAVVADLQQTRSANNR